MQWVAMITMLLDHIGAVWLPDQLWIRMIGRIAFPIYAYLIVQGYQRTRNYPAYVWRLLLIAMLAQLPFMVDFQVWHLNAVFTLLAGLLCIRALDRQGSRWDMLLAIAAAAIIWFVHSDYGFYGVILILLYRYMTGVPLIIAHIVLTALYSLYGYFAVTQMISVLATIWIASRGKLRLPSPPRWMWRSFYPAHLAILAAIILLKGTLL